MSATTKGRRRLTGFCNPHMAKDSHARCTGDYVRGPAFDPVPCECDCHEAPAGDSARTGLVHGLDEQEYHADRGSLSVSGAKVLTDEGPAAFRWMLDHPRTSDAFDHGSAAHKLVLGVGQPIEIVRRTITDRKGEVLEVVDAPDFKSQSAQDHREEIRARGSIPLLAKDYAVVRAMADALSSHATAMRLLSEGEPEVSAYCPDEATGVLRRGRVDWLHPRILVDYKTTAGSVHPLSLAGRWGAVRKWGYDRQAAWYLDLLRDLGHPAEVFAFIFQSKVEPYPVTVAVVRDDDLWEARERNADALRIFRECTDSGRWPGPIRNDGWAVLSLTDQTYIEETL